MLSNFVSVIIRKSKIPHTTSLKSSNFDAKELMWSAPYNNITNTFNPNIPKFGNTILLASFIRTDFYSRRNKTGGFINFFRWFFHYLANLARFCSHNLYKNPYSDGKKLFKCSKKFFDNREVPSLVRWIPPLHKRFLSMFSLHVKAKPKPCINLKKNLPVL